MENYFMLAIIAVAVLVCVIIYINLLAKEKRTERQYKAAADAEERSKELAWQYTQMITDLKNQAEQSALCNEEWQDVRVHYIAPNVGYDNTSESKAKAIIKSKLVGQMSRYLKMTETKLEDGRTSYEIHIKVRKNVASE